MNSLFSFVSRVFTQPRPFDTRDRWLNDTSSYQDALVRDASLQSPRIFSLQATAGGAIAAKLARQPSETIENFREDKHIPAQIFDEYVNSHLVNYKLWDAVQSEDLKEVEALVAQGGCCQVMEPETGKKINLVTYVVGKQIFAMDQRPDEASHCWDDILVELAKCPDYKEAHAEAMQVWACYQAKSWAIS